MANSKVQVNGGSCGSDISVQSQITAALLQNGGVKRIQDTLKQRLDEEGWSQNMREYVVQLFRSGEATTYDDAWTKVMHQIRAGNGAANGANGASAPNLSIPQSAKDDGVEAVKKELIEVCEMDNKKPAVASDTPTPKIGSVEFFEVSAPAEAAKLKAYETVSLTDEPVGEVPFTHLPPPTPLEDGGSRAWLQVLGSFIVFSNLWGFTFAYGTFQTFYQLEDLSASSPSDISWIGTVSTFLLIVNGIISGPLFDNGYFRSMLLIGAGVETLGYPGSSAA
ncbi:hypothetical protein LTR08_001783 [Meristemomyces frigidus]|nr:hypothetical protein LTR08_001783 [Meristemomyces frigidus]